jgi:hypothetical protein
MIRFHFNRNTFQIICDSTASQYQIVSQAKCGAFVVFNKVFFKGFLM